MDVGLVQYPLKKRYHWKFSRGKLLGYTEEKQGNWRITGKREHGGIYQNSIVSMAWSCAKYLIRGNK